MQNWINACSSLLEKECNRKIVSRTYTDERQDGTGKAHLILDNYPISTITALEIRDSADTVIRTVTPASEVIIANEPGKIQLVPTAGYFTKGFRNIVITYTAGYSGTRSRYVQRSSQGNDLDPVER